MFQVYCKTYITYKNVFNCRPSIIIPFRFMSPCMDDEIVIWGNNLTNFTQ